MWENMSEKLILTLCYQCKEIFKDNKHDVFRTDKDIKEPCAICKRFGWEYEILNRGGGSGKAQR